MQKCCMEKFMKRKVFPQVMAALYPIGFTPDGKEVIFLG